jgi:type IV fimbrial biogenesis protein FimT
MGILQPPEDAVHAKHGRVSHLVSGYMRNTNGFSIVELMIVVFLAAIILGLGAPSFAEFQRNNRISGAANDLLGAIQTARTEAIKRQSIVSVCPSADSSAAAASCTAGPFLGWIAFADANGNCMRDDGEDIVRVGVNIVSPPGNPLSAVSNGTCISFAATGFLQGDLDSRATETLFCDNRGTAVDASSSVPDGPTLLYARGVSVSTTGRARVTRDSTEIATWAPDVACP